MRAVLAAAGVGMLLMLAGCGTAPTGHPASHTAPPIAAAAVPTATPRPSPLPVSSPGTPPATRPPTMPPTMPWPPVVVACWVGLIEAGTVTVPFAAKVPSSAFAYSLPPGAWLGDTRSGMASARAMPAYQAGFVVTVTNQWPPAMVWFGGVIVRTFAWGRPSGGPVTGSPAGARVVALGEGQSTWMFADTFNDAGITVPVSDSTYLHTTCTARLIPASGTLG